MIDPSAMDLSRVFDKLHVHYDAICVFSVSQDRIIQLKFPIEENDTLSSGQVLRWSKALRPVIADIVFPADQLMVYECLLPHSMQEALTTPDSRAEIAFRSQNEHWKKLVLHPLSFGREGLVDEVLYLLTDQTVQLNEFEALKAISERDELTFLYNRTKLRQMMEREYLSLRACGVLFFDVNDLKPVNDSRGHAAGDQLLCLVAESLRSVVNRGVHAFRYGGDEFIVVAQDCTAEHLDVLSRMCANRLRTLGEDAGICPSVAVGKAWSEAPCDVQELICMADKAMYENKRRIKAGRQA